MNKSIDWQGLTFTEFVDKSVPRCIGRDSISLVNPQKIYRVLILSKIQIGKEYDQSFDEHYLQPIANELGLNLTKTAKMVALRNAWISYFQKGDIPRTLLKNENLQITNEIVNDYIVLTSTKWSEHPRMRLNYPCKDNSVSDAESWHKQEWHSWYRDQEGEIWFSINEFRSQKRKKVYTSVLEKNAEFSANDIKLAKKRIQELQATIYEQGEIIRAAKQQIRKFQNFESTKNRNGPGRPKISSKIDQQKRRDEAMKFVEQWVKSLQSSLSIKSCGELSRMVSGNKMTWSRWLNKEMLPSSISLEALLDMKIKVGDHQNTKLRDIQTSPTLVDLITLVALV